MFVFSNTMKASGVGSGVASTLKHGTCIQFLLQSSHCTL